MPSGGSPDGEFKLVRARLKHVAAPAEDTGLRQRVRGLLDVQAESRSLDYKQPMSFGPDKRSKGEMVKCIMAFANSRDGGYILVGVEERADGFIPVGLSDEQSRSFDPTDLGDFARNYCSPLPSIRSQAVVIDGLILRLITIDEFDSEPIVCTKDLHDDQGRLVLRAAAFYIRTEDAKCEEVRSSDEMREVLQLAVRKQGDAFLRQARAIFGGVTPAESQSTAMRGPFSTEIQEATEFFEAHHLTGSRWEVLVHPATYQPDRLDRATLRILRRKSEVSIRGWNFPHSDKDHNRAFEHGIESVTNAVHHEEAHRFYTSGLFAWRKRLWEDLPGATEVTNGRQLSFISAIYSLTEYLLFAARYLTELVPDGSAFVRVRTVGLAGRRLASYDPAVPIWDDHLGLADEWERTLEIFVAALRGDHEAIAVAWAHDLFTRVFDSEIDEAVIRDWQEKFLERRF